MTTVGAQQGQVKRRVYTQLLMAASREKRVNLVRYGLALSLVDIAGGEPQGRVETETAVPILAQTFGVKEKTIRNRLHEAEREGLLHFSKSGEHIHYYKQERMANALGQKITSNRAVMVDLAKLGGEVPAVRAFFEHAFVSAGNGRPMTRKRRKELTGRDPRTQRKYERMTGVRVTYRYANFGVYTPQRLQSLRMRGHAAFIHTDHKNRIGGGSGERYIFAHKPSSYEGQLERVKRSTCGIRQTDCNLHNIPAKDDESHHAGYAANEPIQRVFYGDVKAASRAWGSDLLRDAYYPVMDGVSHQAERRLGEAYEVVESLEAFTPEYHRHYLEVRA